MDLLAFNVCTELEREEKSLEIICVEMGRNGFRLKPTLSQQRISFLAVLVPRLVPGEIPNKCKRTNAIHHIYGATAAGIILQFEHCIKTACDCDNSYADNGFQYS